MQTKTMRIHLHLLFLRFSFFFAPPMMSMMSPVKNVTPTNPSGKRPCESDARRDGGGVRDGELAPVVLAPGFDAQEMTRISLQGLSISAVTRGVARSAKETYQVMLSRPSPPLSTIATARSNETHQKTC
jgi:hypothetical protein